MVTTRVAGGFPGQRMLVMPRPVVARALEQPPTDALAVTDCGHFPHALWHGIDRPDGCEEAIVIICASGRGFCSSRPAGRDSDGPPLSLTPGRVLIIPTGVAHRYWTDRRNPWSIWWLHVTGRSVPAWLERFGAERHPVVTPVGDVSRATRIVTDVLATLGGTTGDTAMTIAAAHTWSLLGFLLEEHLRGAVAAEPVRAVQDRLRRDLRRTPVVPELAADVGLSASHLSALFRRATGGGVLAYLKDLRMARARELLAVTGLSVGAVAHQVGYTDPFYFSRQFHRVHGCSPSDYRERLRAGVIVDPATVSDTAFQPSLDPGP